jgi:hypothetical protein
MNLLQIGLTPKQVSHHRRVDFSPSGEATRLVIKADSLATIKYGRNDDDEEAKGVVEDILLPHFKNDVEQAYAALVPIGWLDHCDRELAPDRCCSQSPQWECAGKCQFTSYFQCMTEGGKNIKCEENPKQAASDLRQAGISQREPLPQGPT